MRKFIIVAVLAILGCLFVFKDKIQPAIYYFSKVENTETIVFYIDKSMDLKELSAKLREQQVLKNEKAFLALGNYKGLTRENIALGKYKILGKTSIRQILNGFTKNAAGNGNAEEEVEIVIGNARFVADLAGKIADKLLLDSALLIKELENNERLQNLGLTNRQIHCLLLPNTYRFFYDTNEKEFVDRMADEYATFWSEKRTSQIADIGLNSPAEVVTLASIVYSEQARLVDEWPVIAGLYLNRIRMGMPLQSDPTFKYCWGKELDTVQRLLAVHRKIECDYNTYFISGLPPGPICIPPTGVVDAVLNRAKHNYIYMVALPEYSGKHYFSSNYANHEREAKVFQRWISQEQRKN
ncbi:MAG: endolytic transglycosylase MltG [Bacteroidetes bacterium]|nr:endolytic transglycosylase MltG [Bacteroidota bacterium]